MPYSPFLRVGAPNLHLKHFMSDKKKNIVIIDDQPLFRERLSQLINHQLDMQVGEEAQSL